MIDFVKMSMAEFNEGQYATAIMVCGNPPSPRPDASSTLTYTHLTPEQKRAWSTWAIMCRDTAMQQHWIEDFNGWRDFLRDFLAWYDTEVVKYEQAQQA